MSSWIHTPQVTALLDSLYADAANDRQHHEANARAAMQPANYRERYHNMRKAYMAVGPAFGHLLYTQARIAKARTIVEFGTSFGLSTIYLAAALRDNGGGKVVTTEFEPEKTEQARQNIASAGLSDYVDFRIGDALESLANFPDTIDMLFLDGAKDLYIRILHLLEPRFRPGTIIASDNTDHEEMADFLTYIRTPSNGYTSAAIQTEGPGGKVHEITVRN